MKVQGRNGIVLCSLCFTRNKGTILSQSFLVARDKRNILWNNDFFKREFRAFRCKSSGGKCVYLPSKYFCITLCLTDVVKRPFISVFLYPIKQSISISSLHFFFHSFSVFGILSFLPQSWTCSLESVLLLVLIQFGFHWCFSAFDAFISVFPIVSPFLVWTTRIIPF